MVIVTALPGFFSDMTIRLSLSIIQPVQMLS